MVKNAPIGLAGLVLMGVSLLFLFFIILAGVSDSTPLNKTYFLRADTSGIDGARDVSQWTFFYICGKDNENCGDAKAALPFGWAWNSDAGSDVPEGIRGTHDGTNNKFYLLSRFSWVFILLSLFFGVITFFSSFLACCGRLGSAIASAVGMLTLLCHSVASALTTVTYVLGRDKFKADDRDASLGKYGFGFLWGSYAALLISVVLFSVGTKKDHAGGGGGGAGRFWRRGPSRRESRRVKDDYS
ncbi:Eisosomes component [Lecanicillium sp. MT-2017a]|nr:Eisosomes component [Lecanicillium sp. MT-2017a]